jgi:Archaeal/vacuolar-type H+-ATPase subunit C
VNAASAVMAKARCLYGRHITVEEYDTLASARSVGEFAAILKGLGRYKEALSEVNPAEIHRGALENIISKESFKTSVRLCAFAGAGEKMLRAFVLVKSEIEQILRLVTLLNSGSADEFIVDLPAFLIHHASFDLLAFAHVRDFDSMLAVLSKTPYAKILEGFKPDMGRVADFRGIEYSLLLYYYKNIFKTIDKMLDGMAKTEMTSLVRKEVDLLNFDSALRLKLYYGKSDAYIKSQMLPFYYRLKPSNIDPILAADNAHEMMDMFYKLSHSGNNPYKFDAAVYDRRTYRRVLRSLRFTANSAVSTYVYIELSKIEVKNLFSIIEGIRYGLSPDKIKEHIII